MLFLLLLFFFFLLLLFHLGFYLIFIGPSLYLHITCKYTTRVTCICVSVFVFYTRAGAQYTHTHTRVQCQFFVYQSSIYYVCNASDAVAELALAAVNPVPHAFCSVWSSDLDGFSLSAPALPLTPEHTIPYLPENRFFRQSYRSKRSE